MPVMMFSSPSHGASRAAVVIDFEDLAAHGPFEEVPPVRLNDQYTSRGVTFGGPPYAEVFDYSKGPNPILGLAHSGTKAAEQCYRGEVACPPLSMTFSTPQVRVKVWVGYSFTLVQPQQVTVQAFDSSGAVVTTASTTLAARDGLTPIQTPLEIVSSSENITRATVGLRPGQDNAGLAVDDVEFE